MPPCLVTLQRRANALGYFAHDRFEHRDEREPTDEIALNPKHIIERPPEDTLRRWCTRWCTSGSTGSASRAAAGTTTPNGPTMMQEIGLEPSSTGAPGGKRTGDRVSHYIVAGGPFDLACQAFLAKNPGLLWGDRPVEPKSGGKRAKYVCPEDGIAMWGRPGVQLLCGEHEAPVPMAEVMPMPARRGDRRPIGGAENDPAAARAVRSDPGRPGLALRDLERQGPKEVPDVPHRVAEAICALPVKRIAAKRCRLFLWVSNPHLHHGAAVIRAWGCPGQPSLP